MTEWVSLVDEHDRVVGRAPRSEVRARNLRHRGIGVLCTDSRGRIYVHRRTSTKDVFPCMYDMFVGGVVVEHEDYLTAATREVAEELGVAGAPLEFLFDHLYEGDRNCAWIRVYRVVWDGPIVHQPEEIEWGSWMEPEEVRAWAERVPIVPDGMAVYRELLARGLG